MLMGLTTVGPDGEVVGGAAASWGVSADGLLRRVRTPLLLLRMAR